MLDEMMSDCVMKVKNSEKREGCVSFWFKGILLKPYIFLFKPSKEIDFTKLMKHQMPSLHIFFFPPHFFFYTTAKFANYP